MKSKIFVNKMTNLDRFLENQDFAGRFVLTQITTGSQGIMNASDPDPFFMLASQTIVSNSATLQRTIQIDPYEISITNTAPRNSSGQSNYSLNGKDFFDFFIFEMVSPVEGSLFLNKTLSTQGTKYVFNTTNSSGQVYQYNQLGVKIVELKVSLDASSQIFQEWIRNWRLAKLGNIVYPAMISINSIGSFRNFGSYDIDPSTRQSQIDVFIKV